MSNSPRVELGGASVLNEDSFVQRRTLFRAIWDSATQLGSDKEGSADEQTVKRKVIETLRLDDLGKSAVRRKRQRIKNLRSVCKKILDFCDRQEEDQNTLAIVEHNLKDIDGISSKTKRSKNVKKSPQNIHQITEDIKMDVIGKTARRHKSPLRLESVPEKPTKSSNSRKTRSSTVPKTVKLKNTFSYTGRRRVVNKKKRPMMDTSDFENDSGPLAGKRNRSSPYQ